MLKKYVTAFEISCGQFPAFSVRVKSVSQLTVQLSELGATGP